MNTDFAITEVKGREVSFHYDVSAGKVTVRFGESYEDEEAAEFFGDALKNGESAGIVFTGIGAYTPVNDDHVQIGKLVDISFEGGSLCRLTVVNYEVPGLGGDVRFSFERMERLYA
jgi:hypothetical protein